MEMYLVVFGDIAAGKKGKGAGRMRAKSQGDESKRIGLLTTCNTKLSSYLFLWPILVDSPMDEE
jgi:hypothetical protein